MTVNWERWARGAGIGFVVFAVLAFVVGGETPTVGDPVEDVISYYDGDRGKVLVSSALFAIGLGFWIWFAGMLANNFRERGEGRVAATIIGAVAAFVAIQSSRPDSMPSSRIPSRARASRESRRRSST
jgi:hypothetical protein